MGADSLSHADLAHALLHTLDHARIRSVRQHHLEPHTLLVECRCPGQNHWLVIALEPPLHRVAIQADKVPAPASPSPFVMLLRKHCEGLKLLSIDADPARPAITFTLGIDAPVAYLVVELDRQHLNAVLLDVDRNILGAMFPRALDARGMRYGSVYQPPANVHATYALRGDAPWPSEPDALWPAIATTIAQRREAFLEAQLRRSAKKRIQQALKRAARTVDRVEHDLQRAEDADTLRHEADLLQSARASIARGASFVDVPDWNDPNFAPRRIALDPARSVHDAIERRYKSYRRYREAETRILERLEQVEQQRVALLDASERLATLTTAAQLEHFLRKLESSRLLPRVNAQAIQREAGRLPYREALSSDGFRILVGRTSKDNDTLTLKIARGRDIWMHARDSAGSHVIIWRDRGEDVPERTLREAATLAACFSSAKSDARVDVGWTEKKHVSKPPGSPPGRVSVASMKTLLVTPDEALATQLLDNAKAKAADIGGT